MITVSVGECVLSLIPIYCYAEKAAQDALDTANNRLSTESAKIAPLEAHERDLRRQKGT